MAALPPARAKRQSLALVHARARYDEECSRSCNALNDDNLDIILTLEKQVLLINEVATTVYN